MGSRRNAREHAGTCGISPSIPDYPAVSWRIPRGHMGGLVGCPGMPRWDLVASRDAPTEASWSPWELPPDPTRTHMNMKYVLLLFVAAINVVIALLIRSINIAYAIRQCAAFFHCGQLLFITAVVSCPPTMYGTCSSPRLDTRISSMPQ